ncbi:MAG: hypothetical protein RIM23_06990 [Coleofasciculus sp. G3-WIS-01]|uniref:hypothetical protein n=1 Tax=Coleofasciculus sp. G3-WIS-01 TaxID=3069528 RepID=UPI0033005C4F
MLRKFIIIFMSLSLCLTTLACGSASVNKTPNKTVNVTSNAQQFSNGKYPVQQATYDDVSGEYNLMLLNTPAGTPPVFRSPDLRLARLTDEEIAAGKKAYLQIENGQADMYLSEDFRIEYVHNVTQTQTNTQTGQPETVIVRRESSFWTPFAGAMAGQALGSLLFRPSYYVPPVYQPGGIMTGYGGYGSTYSQAVDRYQARHNQPPPAVKNRQAFRSTGQLRRSSDTSATADKNRQTGNRATGSGFGSSNLRPSNKSDSTRRNRSGGFGSNSGSRQRSTGRRRR